MSCSYKFQPISPTHFRRNRHCFAFPTHKSSYAWIMPHTQRSKNHQLDAIPQRSLVALAITSVSLVFGLAGPQSAQAQSGLAQSGLPRIAPNIPSADSTENPDKPVLAVERPWMDTRPRFINSKVKNSSISNNGALVPLSAIPQDRSLLPPTTELLTPLPNYSNQFDRNLFKNASQYYHHRLLFEDYWRERYGISRGCLPGSPAIGATNLFLGQTVLLPVQAAKTIPLKLIPSGDAAP
jgi:hypothetical protein